MKIQHKQTEGGLFYIQDGSKYVANLEYIYESDNNMVILHTMVAKSLEGKGIGRSLVEAAVTFARKKQIKIKPVCPFARSIMRKDEEFADLMVE